MYVPDDDNYMVDGENFAPPRPRQENKKKTDRSQLIKIGALVGIVLVIGLSVFFISSLFFNNNKKETPTSGISSTLSVDDPEVRDLYEMVTYGRGSNTLNKYLTEQSVTLKNFSNYEKFYYALSFLKEKEVKEIKSSNTTNTTTDTEKTYSISSEVMDSYMKSYFGEEVTYLKQGTIPVVLEKEITLGNTLSLKYNINQERYESSITKTNKTSDQLIPVALYALESATRNDQGDITLVERVIYTTSSVNNNLVSYQVYRDYNHTMLITSLNNISLEEYQKSPLSIDNYMDQGNAITYRFKEKAGEYYFYQSTIEQ